MVRFVSTPRETRCPRCDVPTVSGFCRACRREFERVAAPCVACGQPQTCAPCPAQQPGWQLDALRAPFVYAAPLATLIRALKYSGRRDLGPPLASLMAEAMSFDPAGIDAIVHVPLHPKRLRERRFNQADEIARVLAHRLRIGHLASGIERRLARPPQTELGRIERERLPAASFEIRRRDLANCRIAIVDDVITTAATVNALAKRLRGAGAVRVEAWSVARSVGARTEAGYRNA